MKHHPHLITAACVAALAFCGVDTASAQSKKSASPSPAASASPAGKAGSTTGGTAKSGGTAKESTTTSTAPAGRAIPLRGLASAVDSSAKTFTIASASSSRVFKVTNNTKVTRGSADATFADLKDGEYVTGSYWKHDDGTLEMKSLKLGGKTGTETGPAPRKSKKAKDEDAEAGDE